MKVERIELGCAGHFIAAASCRYRRHTQIGHAYRVSTVGDMRYREKRDRVGSGDTDFYETMVFQTLAKPDKGNDGCGCRAIKNWSEMECDRYATAGEAQAGHERLVSKYLRLARKEAR